MAATVRVKGGTKLKAALREISQKLSKRATLEVGFMEGATYPDGTSVAEVAAFQEFGTGSIPARPFFRNMIAKEKGGWADKVVGGLKAHGYDATRTLNLLGQDIGEALQQSIIETNSPPLSPVTLMLRKMKSKNPNLKVTGKTVGEAAARVAAGESTSGESTKALVETGHMLNSVTSRVEE